MKPESTGVWIEYSRNGIENNETLVFVHGLVMNIRQFELRERFFARITACSWHPYAVLIHAF
jgi:pimeloyl-ACP methyl ester carboxylesterase